MKEYFLRHLQVFFATLGQLARAPFASIMTVAVIGITLALPAVLHVALQNMQRLSGGWEESTQISLFLKTNRASTAEPLAARIRALPGVDGVEHVTPAAALAEFKRVSGFGETLDLLEGNPLPAVLLVRPTAGLDTEALASLVRKLGAEPDVDIAQLDLQWVQRLQAILHVAERAVLILSVLLSTAVVLIVGNTIRLAVLNRRAEIEIIKLIGGTSAFIRRPFLYMGVIQAFLGGLIAWLLVSVALGLLAGPIRELTGLYGSTFRLHGLGLTSAMAVIWGSTLLGYLGARLAVQRHLREIP